MTRNNQQGLAHIAAIMVVVVIAVIAFVGFRVYNQNQDNGTGVSTQEQAQNEPPEVNNSDDLEEAENYLNEQNVDEELDTGEIDSVLEE